MVIPACGSRPGAGPAAFPAFQFRARHENPDWRRLSTVDVERVSREGDVAALQVHLEHVTFCNAERECCPHCQGPADPLLLKLLRLAQLNTEYLLHSQEYLSAQLGSLEEALRETQAQRDQLGKEVAQRLQEIQGLKEECRRRKKMISTQQMMMEARANYHQYHSSRNCNKPILNLCFFQIDQKNKGKIQKLQDEIEKLKEQLQLTKSQLELEQQANLARLSKECEQQKSKEEEILQSFHKWKDEEREQLADQIEKVKDMFMKELKELYSRNSTLENQLVELQKSNVQQKSNLGTLKDSHEFTDEKLYRPQDHPNVVRFLDKQEKKWTSLLQALRSDHESEKSLLLSQIETIKSSAKEDLNKNSIFYKKKIDELEQRLQEQNDLVVSQKMQVCFVKHYISEKQAPLVHMLEPIEELSEEEKGNRCDHKLGRSNHLINALKSDPSLTKELRVVLEQALEEKLESLGVKAGVRGISSDRLNKILRALGYARECKHKQEPSIHGIRENLKRQVSFRVEEKSSPSSRSVSSLHLPGEGYSAFWVLFHCLTFFNFYFRFYLTVFLYSCFPIFHINILTPPFSSEEEADEEDVKQPYTTPEILQKQSKPSSSIVHAFQKPSSKSSVDGMEGNETEETGTPAKTSKGFSFCLYMDVVTAVHEFLTEADEDDWDISSVEEDILSIKNDRVQKALTVQKNEPIAASVVHAWGLPKKSAPKEEGLHEADNTSTLKSSLVTVTDWSDSSDI
uniref:DAZ interacting zinc finger protein 1 n=1 Tax=Malurus cyaneus samueli TaxID=2593467 RepID=A0A8C5X7M0_9PASS